MYGRQKAFVEPELLVWARERISATIEIAAKKSKIDPADLAKWESGKDYPSFAQLRRLGKFYRLSVAVFFLPKPPTKGPKGKPELRRLAERVSESLSVEFSLDVISSLNRRDIILEIFKSQKVTPKTSLPTIDEADSPSAIAQKIRKHFGLTFQQQSRWKDPRVGFNNIRNKVEDAGVLVFQISDIPLEELRGAALNLRPLPIIIVNRKDSYSARMFTIMHELVHILLNSDDISDIEGTLTIPPEEVPQEVWINKVAAEILVNSSDLDAVLSQVDGNDEDEIRKIARTFAVSPELIARRLLERGEINNAKYKKVRTLGALRARARRPGIVLPDIDCLSLNGKPFVRAIASQLNVGEITQTTACQHLGIKPKWLDGVLEKLT